MNKKKIPYTSIPHKEKKDTVPISFFPFYKTQNYFTIIEGDALLEIFLCPY
jgi:hypothetical protein